MTYVVLTGARLGTLSAVVMTSSTPPPWIQKHFLLLSALPQKSVSWPLAMESPTSLTSCVSSSSFKLERIWNWFWQVVMGTIFLVLGWSMGQVEGLGQKSLWVLLMMSFLFLYSEDWILLMLSAHRTSLSHQLSVWKFFSKSAYMSVSISENCWTEGPGALSTCKLRCHSDHVWV